MGTQATYKSSPDGIELYVHVKTGNNWDKERYDENYGDYVPDNDTHRVLDRHATVLVDMDENGDIYGFVVKLTDSAKGFKYAVTGNET